METKLSCIVMTGNLGEYQFILMYIEIYSSEVFGWKWHTCTSIMYCESDPKLWHELPNYGKATVVNVTLFNSWKNGNQFF